MTRDWVAGGGRTGRARVRGGRARRQLLKPTRLHVHPEPWRGEGGVIVHHGKGVVLQQEARIPLKQLLPPDTLGFPPLEPPAEGEDTPPRKEEPDPRPHGWHMDFQHVESRAGLLQIGGGLRL